MGREGVGDTVPPQARFRYGSHRNGTKLEDANFASHTSLRAGVLTVRCLCHSIPVTFPVHIITGSRGTRQPVIYTVSNSYSVSIPVADSDSDDSSGRSI